MNFLTTKIAFIFLLGIFLASCNVNKQTISIEVISDKAVLNAVKVGCFLSENRQAYDQNSFIYLEHSQGIYMQINGKTEKFFVNRTDDNSQTSDELSFTDIYSNENYQIKVLTEKSNKETESIFTGKISVQNLKNNATKSIDFYGYCGY